MIAAAIIALPVPCPKS